MNNAVQLEESIEKLKVSWRELSTTLELKTKVSVTQRHRMVAHSLDIINFSGIFIETHSQWLSLVESEIKRTAGMSHEEWSKDSQYRIIEDMKIMDRNAVSYKAMYYFIRALQDAVYGVLLELGGKKSKKYLNMSRCSTDKKDSVNQILSKEFPNYFKWFDEFRTQRNKIKEGITYGGGYDSDRRLSLNMHIVREEETPPYIDIDFVLDIDDIIKAVEMSVSLLDFTNKFAVENTSSD